VQDGIGCGWKHPSFVEWISAGRECNNSSPEQHSKHCTDDNSDSDNAARECPDDNGRCAAIYELGIDRCACLKS
jgi:hypothetical protein